MQRWLKQPDRLGMPANPPLSVIVPVYNGELYIAETLASILGQLKPDDQLIVVDDGSTDGTPDILSKMAEPALIISQANAGESAAVNRGVSEANSDIVGVVNADDPILPGLLDGVRSAFAEDVTLAGVYPDWLRIDQEGQAIREVRTLDYDYQVMLAQHMCIPGPGAFFRRSMLGAEPVRDARATGISDFDFWLRFGRHGAKVRRIPQVLACWRSHQDGTTYTFQTPALAAAKVAMIERLFAMPDLPNALKPLRAQALSAATYHAALVGLRGRNVPVLTYILASYWHKLIWPKDLLSHQRRSAPHLVYAALQPISGFLHDLAAPLLPRRFHRNAVLDQTFGLLVPPGR